ncbi:MAG: hypothetical protein WA190_01820 [Usitatibacter sp.]
MTREQRRIVQEWAFLGTVLILFFLFVPIVTDRPWVKWLLFPFVIFARAYGGEPARDPEGRGWINQLVEDNPWLKWWGILCAVVIFAGAVYLIKARYEIEEPHVFAALIGSFAVVLGPFVVVHERKRFLSSGE